MILSIGSFIATQRNTFKLNDDWLHSNKFTHTLFDVANNCLIYNIALLSGYIIMVEVQIILCWFNCYSCHTNTFSNSILHLFCTSAIDHCIVLRYEVIHFIHSLTCIIVVNNPYFFLLEPQIASSQWGICLCSERFKTTYPPIWQIILFCSLEVVDRVSDTQLQVSENISG